MKQLYRTTLLVLLSCCLFASCGGDDSDSDDCANYTGPALTKRPDGNCFYTNPDGSTTVLSGQSCKCAK